VGDLPQQGRSAQLLDAVPEADAAHFACKREVDEVVEYAGKVVNER
jgi:hypothetical protein